MTDLLFSEDSYLKTIDAKITKIEHNAVITNRTIFYAESQVVNLEIREKLD